MKNTVLSLSWQSKENILINELKVALSSGSISPDDASRLKNSGQGLTGFIGEADLVLTRTQQNKAIVGVVSGTAKGVLKSYSFIIPRLTALAACGSLPNETIQSRTGSRAQLTIRPSTCDRTVVITLIHSERQEIVPGRKGTVNFTLPDKTLPAGGSMLVEAYNPEGPAVTRSLSLSATVSRP